MPLQYPDNAITKEARAKAGGGFESAIENAAPAAQRVISGTGFGSGPTVVHFDSMSAGTDGADVDFVNGPEIGQWAGDLMLAAPAGAIPGAKYYAHNGRIWLAGRDPSRLTENSVNAQGLIVTTSEPFTEFHLAFRNLIPDGFLMPGASVANSNQNSGSNWKMTWGGTPETGWGPLNPGPDVCIPSITGTGPTVQVVGNSIRPLRYNSSASGSAFFASVSAANENVYSWYQAPESVEGAKDGTIDFIYCNGDGANRSSVNNDADPFNVNVGTPSVLQYRNFLFNGLMSNAPTWVNVLSAWADMYLAINENSRACIMASDSPVFSSSTKLYVIPPDSWTDTEIKWTPRSWEDLAYTHVRTANGTLIENAEGV